MYDFYIKTIQTNWKDFKDTGNIEAKKALLKEIKFYIDELNSIL